MLFYPQEKLAIFIDGAKPLRRREGLQFDIDYKRLLELFARKGILVRAFYYTAVAEDQEFSPLRPLVDWLDYNGFRGRDQAAQGIHRCPGAPAASKATWTSSSPST